jgi:hypothetical protein
MRPLPVLLPLVLLLAAPEFVPEIGPDLVTDYGRVRTLRTTTELELRIETVSMEMRIDDEPAEERGPGGSSSSLARRAVLVDQVLEGGAGEPAHVKRTFEALHDEFSFSFGEEERSDERDYPLQGVTLELTLDEDGTPRCELVEGTKPDDEALLEGHELALALDAFLPPNAVELGAAWELDDEAVRRAFALALDRRLFAEPPPDEGSRGERGGRGSGRGGPGRSLGLCTWKGKAVLEALDAEHEGRPCARIALELEGSGDLPEPPSRGPGGRGFAFTTALAPALEGTVEVQLEGELLFSPELARPLALELEGEVQIESRFEREREGRRFSMHS